MTPKLLAKDGALIYVAGMNIDADGAPNAYHPTHGGLDFLANAGKPGNWYGLVCDAAGEPLVQGPGDPCPGFYVSPTALGDRMKEEHDPTRYVNSGAVSYIAVPPDLKAFGVKLGDLCVAFYQDLMWPGIVADIGPRGKFGEASMCMAAHLGIRSSPKNGGVDGGVTYWIKIGTATGWPRPDHEAESMAAFEAWGGLERLRALAPGQLLVV